jgi:hypothetical protein
MDDFLTTLFKAIVASVLIAPIEFVILGMTFGWEDAWAVMPFFYMATLFGLMSSGDGDNNNEYSSYRSEGAGCEGDSCGDGGDGE